jgi:O-antigen chain-terminating methyltransferase
MPAVHARDAAQAKVAAIGSVNPRAGGPLNNLIQFFKKTVARALQWFVRDQVAFNRETVSVMEALLEALNEHNHSLLSLAGQTNDQIRYVRADVNARVFELSMQIDARAAELSASLAEHELAVSSALQSLRADLEAGIEGARLRILADRESLSRDVESLRAAQQASAHLDTDFSDLRNHWIEWRTAWEQKLSTNEIQFLRAAADLQGAFQHRVIQIESNFRDIVKMQHADYLGALDRSTLDVQRRLWADLERVRADYEKLIHTELRLIRQRLAAAPPAEASAVSVGSSIPLAPLNPPGLDYSRFAERFRGSEDQIRRSMEFYKPVFAGCANVLDIGCGRGEFLSAMREIGVPAHGIDLGAEQVAHCREAGLDAQVADLFDFLTAQPDGEFDGIVSSQVVEHLPPNLLPEMVRLCGAKLRRGGILAVDTPNPECLAIFATYFYLDPTHTRPVPPQLMGFLMEEAGCVVTGVYPLSPASETIPELAALPEAFKNRFFGGLDYAIVARKL